MGRPSELAPPLTALVKIGSFVVISGSARATPGPCDARTRREGTPPASAGYVATERGPGLPDLNGQPSLTRYGSKLWWCPTK